MVASLVVFEDGLPRKSDYRHYAIREAAGDGRSDDVASIAEVTRRRFARHASTCRTPTVFTAEGKSRKFAYPPNLYVVDGGAPQVNAAAAVLDELGVSDVAVIGLAKRLEEVWVPSEPDPVIMPRNSEGLYLLQRVRDEAHRFAITYHRSKRSKRMTASALDSVRGLGEHRRKALVTHFGSVARLQAGQRRGDHRGARDRRRDCQGGAGSARCTARFVERPPRLSAMIRPGHRDDGSERSEELRDRRRRRQAAESGIDVVLVTGSPERAAARRPRFSRISAGTSRTTCRPS